MVQVREKDLSHVELTGLVRAVIGVTGGRSLVLVNGDAAAAAEAGADGVHLPESDGTVSEARAASARPVLVGRSVHSAAAAAKARLDGADYVLFGTVFPSRSHQGGGTAGIGGVSEAVAACGLPVIGIGGIGHANAGSVVRAGAYGVAVISSVLAAPDPESAAADLKRALGAAGGETHR
jgi:thiamine-phosphate pyrophosphorylase